jgi:hypothetical protein
MDDTERNWRMPNFTCPGMIAITRCGARVTMREAPPGVISREPRLRNSAQEHLT